jgi:hypothetical protein
VHRNDKSRIIITIKYLLVNASRPHQRLSTPQLPYPARSGLHWGPPHVCRLSLWQRWFIPTILACALKIRSLQQYPQKRETARKKNLQSSDSVNYPVRMSFFFSLVNTPPSSWSLQCYVHFRWDLSPHDSSRSLGNEAPRWFIVSVFSQANHFKSALGSPCPTYSQIQSFLTTIGWRFQIHTSGR